MARDVESLPPEDKVRRQVGRTVVNWSVAIAAIAILAVWFGYYGYYEVKPGEAAIILRFGNYVRTIDRPGPGFHLPPPLEHHDIVKVASIEREEFGFVVGQEASSQDRLEGIIQTRDNNIVNVNFVVQYRIKDAFFSRYRIANPRETLRDAAQATIREVIGRTSIDGVLSDKRGEVQAETLELLQQQMDRYESGLLVERVELKDAQPPPEVRDAFDDVIAAAQDRSRRINEAEGYANEVLPAARAKAAELTQSAGAYRDTKVAQAAGDASRFTALLVEYRKAPAVTRQRLYLEAMEEIMPNVEKVIIEPGAASVFPYLPLGRSSLEPMKAGRSSPEPMKAGRSAPPAAEAPRAAQEEGSP